MKTLPPDTTRYGADFHAIQYAENAGFNITVDAQRVRTIARRDDIPEAEYVLRSMEEGSAGTRWYWEKRKVHVDRWKKAS